MLSANYTIYTIKKSVSHQLFETFFHSLSVFSTSLFWSVVAEFSFSKNTQHENKKVIQPIKKSFVYNSVKHTVNWKFLNVLRQIKTIWMASYCVHIIMISGISSIVSKNQEKSHWVQLCLPFEVLHSWSGHSRTLPSIVMQPLLTRQDFILNKSHRVFSGFFIVLPPSLLRFRKHVLSSMKVSVIWLIAIHFNLHSHKKTNCANLNEVRSSLSLSELVKKFLRFQLCIFFVFTVETPCRLSGGTCVGTRRHLRPVLYRPINISVRPWPRQHRLPRTCWDGA